MSKERILETYEIGDLKIRKELNYKGEVVFATQKDNWITRHYPTLDMAIAGALALKYDGSNTQADRFICQMLSIGDKEFWK